MHCGYKRARNCDTPPSGCGKPRRSKRFFRMADAFKENAFYFGGRGRWWVVAAQHRDSTALDRSNFAAMRRLIEDAKGGYAIESAGHWAVGWLEYLLVDGRDRNALRAAIHAHIRLNDYPILDEDAFSQLEWNEFMATAECELQNYSKAWKRVLRAVEDKNNWSIGCGDEHADWLAIEEARRILKAHKEVKEGRLAWFAAWRVRD